MITAAEFLKWLYVFNVPLHGEPGTGTVTNVGTGTGLTGGPITASGVISFATVSTGSILANISGSTAAPTPNTLTAIIDATIGSTQGDVLYRNATGWVVLPPATAGYVFTTGGAGANPSWQSSAADGALLIVNNLDDVANAATSLANIGGLALAGGTMTGNINMGVNLIRNLANPLDPGDAVNLETLTGYVQNNPVTPGYVLLGNASSDATYTAITGAISISDTGVSALASIADGDILSNITGSSAAPVGNTLSATIDHVMGSTQGDVLYRNATGWVSLPPGVSGYFLQTQGSAANPIWAAGSGGSVTSVGTGTGLTGGTITTTGTISLATIANNDLLANISGITAAPTPTTLTALIDSAIGSTQGDILYRNATGWVVLSPSTSGYFLQTLGSAANPIWAPGPSTSVTFTGDSGTPFSGSAVTVTGGTSGLTFGAASPDLTLTGILKLAFGGTNANLTAVAGGMVYSSSTAMAFTAAGSSGQLMQSAGTSAPGWTSATFPSSTTINQLLFSSANNVIGGITAGNYGVLISSAAGVPSWLANGTTGQVLTATTSGIVSWASPAASSVTFTGDSGTPFSGAAVTVTGGSTGLTYAAGTPDLTLAGILKLAFGGTNADLTASNGGLIYSTATAMAVLAGTATANQIPVSGSSSAPSWVGLSALMDTILGGTQGDILYRNATVWTVLAPGVSGYFLQTQGSAANPIWAVAGGGSNPWSAGSGTDSAVGGDGSQVASGNYSLAWGSNTTTATNAGDIAMGYGCVAAGGGTAAVALGYNNHASGAGSFCAGYFNNTGARGAHSIVLGQQSNTSTGDTNSVAIGYGANTRAGNQIAMCADGNGNDNIWVAGQTTTGQMSFEAVAIAHGTDLQNATGPSGVTGRQWCYGMDNNGNFIHAFGVADQSKSVQTPTTGFSITIALGVSSLILTPAAALASGTITMPAAPIDGQIIQVSSTKAITALTVSANAGQSIFNAPTTIGAGQGFGYKYHLAITSWLPTYNTGIASSGGGGPSASVTASTAPTFAGAGTYTIPFDTINWDTAGYYNVSTYAYTPLVAGTYKVDIAVSTSTVSAGGIYWMGVALNGTIYKYNFGTTVSTFQQVSTSCLVQMNGSTDYITVQLYTQSTAHSIQGLYFDIAYVGPL